MDTNFENLIDLSILKYYDESLRAQIKTEVSGAVEFIEDELPEEGKQGVLYIVNNSIKIWNGEKFVDIVGSDKSFTWGTF